MMTMLKTTVSHLSPSVLRHTPTLSKEAASTSSHQVEMIPVLPKPFPLLNNGTPTDKGNEIISHFSLPSFSGAGCRCLSRALITAGIITKGRRKRPVDSFGSISFPSLMVNVCIYTALKACTQPFCGSQATCWSQHQRNDLRHREQSGAHDLARGHSEHEAADFSGLALMRNLRSDSLAGLKSEVLHLGDSVAAQLFPLWEMKKWTREEAAVGLWGRQTSSCVDSHI